MATRTGEPWVACSGEHRNGSLPAVFLTEANQADAAGGWSQIVAELSRIRQLRHDWDGMGAEAPPAELVESAMAFTQFLRQQGMRLPSRVAAGPNGTVLFEWQEGEIYLEAEITKPHYAEWMLLSPGQSARHWVTS